MDNIIRKIPRLKIVVCDIDGCLVDSSHRTAQYFAGNRDEYELATTKDTVIPQGQMVYQAIHARPDVFQLFVTSRGDNPRYRDLTMEQLRAYVSPDIQHHQLLMRAPEVQGLEVMSDEVYKVWAVENAGYDPKDVWMAFDDRECVVAMWRARGVLCYHTQPGDH